MLKCVISSNSCTPEMMGKKTNENKNCCEYRTNHIGWNCTRHIAPFMNQRGTSTRSALRNAWPHSPTALPSRVRVPTAVGTGSQNVSTARNKVSASTTCGVQLNLSREKDFCRSRPFPGANCLCRFAKYFEVGIPFTQLPGYNKLANSSKN